MASSTVAVTVTTSATQLVAENFERIALHIDNQGGQTVFIGTDSSVTASTGITLADGAKLIFDYEGGHPQFFFQNGLWGIVAATTADVRVMELVRTRSAAS